MHRERGTADGVVVQECYIDGVWVVVADSPADAPADPPADAPVASSKPRGRPRKVASSD